MRIKYLVVAGTAALLLAAGGTGLALASTSAPAATPAAVPASAGTTDVPEPGDTPDQQGPDTPEPGDTPDAPGQG